MRKNTNTYLSTGLKSSDDFLLSNNIAKTAVPRRTLPPLVSTEIASRLRKNEPMRDGSIADAMKQSYGNSAFFQNKGDRAAEPMEPRVRVIDYTDPVTKDEFVIGSDKQAMPSVDVLRRLLDDYYQDSANDPTVMRIEVDRKTGDGTTYSIRRKRLGASSIPASSPTIHDLIRQRARASARTPALAEFLDTPEEPVTPAPPQTYDDLTGQRVRFFGGPHPLTEEEMKEAVAAFSPSGRDAQGRWHEGKVRKSVTLPIGTYQMERLKPGSNRVIGSPTTLKDVGAGIWPAVRGMGLGLWDLGGNLYESQVRMQKFNQDAALNRGEYIPESWKPLEEQLQLTGKQLGGMIPFKDVAEAAISPYDESNYFARRFARDPGGTALDGALLLVPTVKNRYFPSAARRVENVAALERGRAAGRSAAGLGRDAVERVGRGVGTALAGVDAPTIAARGGKRARRAQSRLYSGGLDPEGILGAVDQQIAKAVEKAQKKATSGVESTPGSEGAGGLPSTASTSQTSGSGRSSIGTRPPRGVSPESGYWDKHGQWIFRSEGEYKFTPSGDKWETMNKNFSMEAKYNNGDLKFKLYSAIEIDGGRGSWVKTRVEGFRPEIFIKKMIKKYNPDRIVSQMILDNDAAFRKKYDPRNPKTIMDALKATSARYAIEEGYIFDKFASLISDDDLYIVLIKPKKGVVR
jgi:hypothetical protein